MKNYFFYAAMAAAMLTACNQNNDPQDADTDADDSGTLTADLKNYMIEADNALRTAPQLTITVSAEFHPEDDVKKEYDVIAKRVRVVYQNSLTKIVEQMGYIDGNAGRSYGYNRNGYDDSDDTIRLNPPVTDAEKYYYARNEGFYYDSDEVRWTFKRDDGNIVAMKIWHIGRFSGADTIIYTITLNENMKYKLINEYTSLSFVCGDECPDDRIRYTREYTFSYTANIDGLPQGFEHSQFPDRTGNYKYAVVKWNNGTNATNKFWHTTDIKKYAPDYAGKEISGFKIAVRLIPLIQTFQYPAMVW